jgi:large subunit ribosomal protein L9
MEVILLERIHRLGQMGDVVRVRDGFARNFLLPQGKALRSTETNKQRFEREREQLEARNQTLKEEAQQVGGRLDGQSFVAIRQASETGQLYGSVSTRDVADLVAAGGFDVARNQIRLDSAIKTIGLHPVVVQLHPEVEVTVNINVARSEDEAARQARGEDVTRERFGDEDEDELAPEDVFETPAGAEEGEPGDEDSGA